MAKKIDVILTDEERDVLVKMRESGQARSISEAARMLMFGECKNGNPLDYKIDRYIEFLNGVYGCLTRIITFGVLPDDLRLETDWYLVQKQLEKAVLNNAQFLKDRRRERTRR